MHADPAELSLSGDEVLYNGEPIDLGYRDYSVFDLLTLQKTGVDVAPMKTLFKQNRMISSIAAELDQKSCWEVLTDPGLHQESTSVPMNARSFAGTSSGRAFSPNAKPSCPKAKAATCSNTSARITNIWCSSRIAPTAARAC